MPFITQGKTNWKYILIVVILAFLVGGGILWLSTKQELPYQPPEIKKPETADWKTYKNEEHGFEIKYPKDWSFHEFSKKFVSFSPPEEEPQVEYPGEITITIYSNLADLPNNNGRLEFNDWIEQQIKDGIFRNKKEITIGTENYKGIEVQDLGIVNFRSVLFSHNSTAYTISIDEDSSEMPIFNQMLSTFKFLE